MSQPNLFKFATSELSQDAFLCWLLSWASPQYQNQDLALHQCAQELLKAFFNQHPDKEFPHQIESIEVYKQDANIDVWCTINDKYAILIEDKTNTSEHDNQLTRYLNKLEERGIDANCIFPIYLKTYEQSDYKPVQKAGYSVFTREHLLGVLSNHQNRIENAIFNDFHDHLIRIQNDVDSFRNTPLDKWTFNAWKGFYQYLQDELEVMTGWNYVPNQNDGFMGAWFCFEGLGDGNSKPYLQLEQSKLCYKIEVDSPDSAIQASLCNYWHSLFLDRAKSGNLNLIKPARFGRGRTMTFCVDQQDYRQTMPDGLIDLKTTANYLRRHIEFLCSAGKLSDATGQAE